MSDGMIVLVSELDDATHGEIHVFDGPDEAAKLVETLLESGFGRERLRVFAASELAVQVTHRPVVSLVSSKAQAKEEDDEQPADSPAAEEEPAPKPMRRAPAMPQAEPVAVDAPPFVKDGMRFSSLFRPA
jgi:hypothetical protein